MSGGGLRQRFSYRMLVTRDESPDGGYVPVKLGAKGVEEIFEVRPTEEELDARRKSASAVGELAEVVARTLDLGTTRTGA